MKPLINVEMIRRALCLLAMVSFLGLTACGGGGGGGGGDTVADVGTPGDAGGGGGIGGSGFSSSGTVDGTGSIFVNGERIDVDNAEFFIDGEPAVEGDIGLGMIVTVTGSRDENGTPFADRVDYDPLIEGDIESIERNVDNSSARLRILGQVVIVERTSTVFEDTDFDALAAGQRVEISGYRDDEDRVRATRLDGDADSADEVTLSGRLSGLNGTRFSIGSQQVDASNASIDSLPGGSLANDLEVEVEGELVDGVLIATEVDDRDDFQARISVDDDVSAQGAIDNFQSVSSFSIEGLPVDASNALISTGGLLLANNLVVEAEGVWNGSVLVADTVVASRGRIELVAPLAAIDGTRLTLQFGNGTVTVDTNARTLVDDDRDDIEFLALSDIGIGDTLEVEALLVDGQLVATLVDRDDSDDETVIQAPVESFVDGLSVTVLGLSFDVSLAEFENAGDDDIEAEDFFRNLRISSLVSIVDEGPVDGFAEEVEFEFAQSFDGDREFLDDDERLLEIGELPGAVITYLAENFPGEDVAFIEADDDEIEVYLADGTEIVFSLAGDFIESDDDEDDYDEESDSDDGSDDDASDDEDGSDDGFDEEDDDEGADEEDEEDEDEGEESDDSEDDDSNV